MNSIARFGVRDEHAKSGYWESCASRNSPNSPFVEFTSRLRGDRHKSLARKTRDWQSSLPQETATDWHDENGWVKKAPLE
ncbi:MAG TPA: hypothetical protein V6C78_17900 [Crinalium sp.]